LGIKSVILELEEAFKADTAEIFGEYTSYIAGFSGKMTMAFRFQATDNQY